MDFLTIIAVALGLSFDTFAVSLSYAVVQNKILFWQAIRMAIVLAVFQAGLFMIGYFLGSIISDIMKAADHWIALALLLFLGIRMIIEGKKRTKDDRTRDYTKPVEIIAVAIATSVDAFTAGISFALLDLRIWLSGIIIGTVTFLASMTAIRIGKSAGEKLGRRVEIVGGLILITIGIKIFLEHILA
jgi:putative Mn2+ efflux pump MntP